MTKLRDVRFRKTNLSSTGQLEFDQDMLTLLMSINEKKTLFQVAKETKMKMKLFKECFIKLYKLKLIEKIEEKVEYVDDQTLAAIQEHLVNLLGPLGEILMQDAAEIINSEMPHIPKNNLVEYVMAIASEIPGEKQSQEFKKLMLQEINGMQS